jgi:hypothetical protein
MALPITACCCLPPFLISFDKIYRNDEDQLAMRSAVVYCLLLSCGAQRTLTAKQYSVRGGCCFCDESEPTIAVDPIYLLLNGNKVAVAGYPYSEYKAMWPTLLDTDKLVAAIKSEGLDFADSVTAFTTMVNAKHAERRRIAGEINVKLAALNRHKAEEAESLRVASLNPEDKRFEELLVKSNMTVEEADELKILTVKKEARRVNAASNTKNPMLAASTVVAKKLDKADRGLAAADSVLGFASMFDPTGISSQLQSAVELTQNAKSVVSD